MREVGIVPARMPASRPCDGTQDGDGSVTSRNAHRATRSPRSILATGIRSRRAITLRRLGARSEQELLHLRLEELPRLRLDRRQAVFVDEHRLMLQPARPRLFGNVLIDALAELAGIGRAVEARRLAPQIGAMNHSRHGAPRLMCRSRAAPGPEPAGRWEPALAGYTK